MWNLAVPFTMRPYISRAFAFAADLNTSVSAVKNNRASADDPHCAWQGMIVLRTELVVSSNQRASSSVLFFTSLAKTSYVY